jgi:hypothetical protein
MTTASRHFGRVNATQSKKSAAMMIAEIIRRSHEMILQNDRASRHAASRADELAGGNFQSAK